MRNSVAMRIAPWLLSGLLLAGCGRMPEQEARTMIQPLPPPADTPLAQAIAPRVSQHPDLTGIYTLSDGRSAFATRGLLVEAAHATLDVQYYIWHDDLSGVLLLEALQRAAERGVRVRLLLDDNGIAGLDPVLVALDAHPNLEVRLYNPFPNRRFKPLGYLTEFRRLNRRMHNKSLTVDGVATIIGGRNIGDEYFGASEGVNFADLDVLAVGQVVGEVSSLFERYWGSASAYPLAAVVRSPPGDAAALLRARYDALGGEAAARGYLEALDRSPLVKDVVRGDLPFDWVTARMVADDPEKTLARGSAHAGALLAPRLAAAIGHPARRFDIVSPYFVPGREGTALLAELAGGGVELRVLTNSLAATDVAAVHAGYAKRRRALLGSGVQLWELKATSHEGATLGDWVRTLGGSGASLHAKTFAVDGRLAFVGSFNFDPRSAALNTEMGFVLDSPRLAEAIHAAFDDTVPHAAWAVRLDSDGRLRWLDTAIEPPQVFEREPDTGRLERAFVGVLSLLPIDALL
jgi:putative cardiolipin synthase